MGAAAATREHLHAARSGIRRRPAAERAYRVGVAVVGSAICVGGLALVPLPGPGWVIVFAGLGLLATEFTWAARLAATGRRILGRWSSWVRARSGSVRTLLAGGAAVAACGLAWAFLAVSGVPGWLPGRLASALGTLPGVT